MRKYYVVFAILVLVATALWLSSCGKDENATSPTLGNDIGKVGQTTITVGPQGGNPNQGQSGTTLSDVVTATCFNYFDWSCTKETPSPADCFKIADCQDVTATVHVTKGDQHMGYNVSICVSNGGSVATTDLKVGATLMYHATGGYTASACAVSGLESQHAVLAAGETYCYTGTITPAPGCLVSNNGSYRVDGDVTITNHSGHLGVPYGPDGKSDSGPLCAPSNDCIDVTDTPGTPDNSLGQPDPTSWTITVTSPNPVNVCASGDVTFTLHICDVAGPCAETWTVDNSATVDQHSCTSSFDLATCECPHGCALTQGFWKTHGCVGPNGKTQYGNNPNLIDPLLVTPITMGNKVITTCGDAGAVFQGAEGNQGNAIKRLYSQMLAALLNMRTGADGSCIASAIDDANAVLSAADPNGDASGWSNVTGAQRSAIQSAAGTFDNYNNGKMCVPHCE